MNETTCRKVVTERSAGVCERCGKAQAHEKHHRLNRSQGGLWEPSNIVDLCNGCHGLQDSNPHAMRAEGWHLYRGEDPHTVPVAHRMLPGLMVLLDDEGCLTTVPDVEVPATAPSSRPDSPIRAALVAADGFAPPIPDRLRADDGVSAERGQGYRRGPGGWDNDAPPDERPSREEL
jgi:5-methylcytosine-specific restriction protein A